MAASPKAEETAGRGGALFPAAAGYAVALGGVALATLLLSFARLFLDAAHVSLLYLVVVALVAYWAGPGPAVLSAFVSFVCWNYFFIEPRHTLYVHEPRDLIALFVFLAAAVLIGELAGRAREQAAAAAERERATSMLYEISTLVSAEADTTRVIPRVLEDVVRATRAAAGALFLAGPGGELEPAALFPPGEPDALDPEWRDQAGEAYATQAPVALDGWAAGLPMYLPLRASERSEGVLLIIPGRPRAGLPRQSRRILLTAATHLAMALERQRLSAAAAQAEALRAAEQFRTTLLSSVSHDLRTPLASIKASVTSLLHSEHSLTDRRDLLQAVNEETDRLNRFVGDLLDISRLEAGAWKPEKEWLDFTEVIGTVLGRLDEDAAARVRLAIPEDLPLVAVDLVQIGQALWNLLENALKYSPPQAPVEVEAAVVGESVLRVTVSDRGPGIPPGEEERIFDKFYRASGDRRPKGVPGTGLGLAIARGIVEAHGGRICALSRRTGGAVLEVLLPLAPPDMGRPPEIGVEPAGAEEGCRHGR